MRLLLVSVEDLQKQRNALPVTLGEMRVDSLAPSISVPFHECTHLQSTIHSTLSVSEEADSNCSYRGQFNHCHGIPPCPPK